MPRRPIPQFPRGPRKKPLPVTQPVLLACPRLRPEWELAALKALVKPQTGTRIAHRSGDQTWSKSADDVLAKSVDEIEQLLGVRFSFHRPDAGDFLVLSEVGPSVRSEALALAWLVSRRLPDLWFVFDRLRVKNGVFHRRRRRFQLELVIAHDIHLSRGTRALLRRLVGSDGQPKRKRTRPAKVASV